MRPRLRPASVRRERPAPWLLVLRAATWLVSAALLLGCEATWYACRSLTHGLTTSDALDAVRGRAPRHLDNSVNLLLIGLDSRKDMNGNDLPRQFVQTELHAGSSDIGYYNTNTLILMHIPACGGKVQAFSIPRDGYVQTLNGDGSVQGHFKIKEAYANAYTTAHDKYAAQGLKGADLEAKSREAGREATLATVQQFTGVPIDHFAEVNLLGFYDIAKVLQPITVCLKHPVKGRHSGADFPAGVQQLNARQALAFVRQRHGAGRRRPGPYAPAVGVHLHGHASAQERGRVGQPVQAAGPVRHGEEGRRPRQQLERARLRPAGPRPHRRQRRVPHPAHRGLRHP